MKFDREKLLIEYYKNKIKTWDWKDIYIEAKNNMEENNEDVGYAYLGTVMYLFPSGKYYTGYSNHNVSKAEELKDNCFALALVEVAGNNGLSIIEGFDDPCDIMAVLN